MELRSIYTTERESTPVPQVIRSNNTSGTPGVSRKRDKWVAKITYKKISYRLGTFAYKEEAIAARKKAEEDLKADPEAFVEKYSASCSTYQNK